MWPCTCVPRVPPTSTFYLLPSYLSKVKTGDGLNGFSTANLTYHPSIARTSKKLESVGVAVGGAPSTRGTCVQGHVGHLGMV